MNAPHWPVVLIEPVDERAHAVIPQLNNTAVQAREDPWPPRVEAQPLHPIALRLELGQHCAGSTNSLPPPPLPRSDHLHNPINPHALPHILTPHSPLLQPQTLANGPLPPAFPPLCTKSGAVTSTALLAPLATRSQPRRSSAAELDAATERVDEGERAETELPPP
jgi:hypothetical protein